MLNIWKNEGKGQVSSYHDRELQGCRKCPITRLPWRVIMWNSPQNVGRGKILKGHQSIVKGKTWEKVIFFKVVGNSVENRWKKSGKPGGFYTPGELCLLTENRNAIKVSNRNFIIRAAKFKRVVAEDLRRSRGTETSQISQSLVERDGRTPPENKKNWGIPHKNATKGGPVYRILRFRGENF